MILERYTGSVTFGTGDGGADFRILRDATSGGIVKSTSDPTAVTQLFYIDNANGKYRNAVVYTYAKKTVHNDTLAFTNKKMLARSFYNKTNPPIPTWNFGGGHYFPFLTSLGAQTANYGEVPIADTHFMHNSSGLNTESYSNILVSATANLYDISCMPYIGFMYQVTTPAISSGDNTFYIEICVAVG